MELLRKNSKEATGYIFHLKMAVPLTVSGVERFRRVGCIAIANLIVTDSVINLQSKRFPLQPCLDSQYIYTGEVRFYQTILVIWLFGLCYAMNGGYRGCNPCIERHLAIFVNYFCLERTNQLSLLPDKDLVDLCSPIEPY